MSSINYNLEEYFSDGLILSDFRNDLLADSKLDDCDFIGFTKSKGLLTIYASNILTEADKAEIDIVVDAYVYKPPSTRIPYYTIDEFDIKTYTNKKYSAYDFIIPFSISNTLLINSKVGFSPPRTFILENVKASLLTTQENGDTINIDIKVNDISILSTPIMIENGQKSSFVFHIQSKKKDNYDQFIYIKETDYIVIEIVQIGVDTTASGLNVMLVGKC
jgi:hypothetical protein